MVTNPSYEGSIATFVLCLELQTILKEGYEKTHMMRSERDRTNNTPCSPLDCYCWQATQSILLSMHIQGCIGSAIIGMATETSNG